EEERLPVPIVASGSFRNFSGHRVAFPREAGAALTFVFTICVKTNSKIRLIRQKLVSFNWITFYMLAPSKISCEP
uniref:hypothetical protein n=1 Tax=Draconibacterium mangrovi TaxID=2697469 RepID=UPI001953CBAD